MSRLLLSIISLTLVYTLVLASFKPWDILIGAIISGGLLLVFQDFMFGRGLKPLPGLLRRVLAFIPFAIAVVIDILKGIWTVALIVLRIRPLPQSGIIAIPIGERSPAGVAICSLVTTLSPGSVLVDIDWERQIMLFHVIEASDPDSIRKAHQDFYERYQKQVFP